MKNYCHPTLLLINQEYRARRRQSEEGPLSAEETVTLKGVSGGVFVITDADGQYFKAKNTSVNGQQPFFLFNEYEPFTFCGSD